MVGLPPIQGATKIEGRRNSTMTPMEDRWIAKELTDGTALLCNPGVHQSLELKLRVELVLALRIFAHWNQRGDVGAMKFPHRG